MKPALALVDSPTYKVALVGNPNSGKTSIFNNLTGKNLPVANYSGPTVVSKKSN